ncbi:MAG: PEGA domain-containing protein [Planctomycetota bacterium]
MRIAVLVSFLFALTATGCVERRLWVRTEPEGASVLVNGKEIGKAPIAWPFEHYGTIVVEAEMPGRERVQRTIKLKAPWYQYPVLDFVADVLWPFTIKDEHYVDLDLPELGRLTPEQFDREIEKLTDSAGKLRDEAQGQDGKQ